MEYTFQYNDTKEREQIISGNSEKYLIYDRRLNEGNFLVFVDKRPIEEQLTELKEKLALQDTVIEELMFSVIPNLTGGGI